MSINIVRIKDLIIRYFVTNTSALIKVVLSLVLTIFVITCLEHINENIMDYEAFVVLFYIAWYIGGFWFSSNVFNEIHKPGSSYRFLTLPATNKEKLIYSWIITSPLVVVIAFIIINIASWLVMGFCNAIYGINFKILNLFDYGFGQIALLYMVLQPVFLLGALYFKRLNFFNTILWLGIIGFGIACLAFFSSLILFYPFSDFNFDEKFFSFIYVADFFEDTFVPAIEIFFWYIMGPFFLLVSYFKLKETEIK